MIGDSVSDYILIRVAISALRLVAPLSLLHVVASSYLGHALLSKYLLPYTLIESIFFLGVYLPRKWSMQTVRSLISPLSLCTEPRVSARPQPTHRRCRGKNEKYSSTDVRR